MIQIDLSINEFVIINKRKNAQNKIRFNFLQS